MYAIPLNNRANTIEKIVVKLNFFNLKIAKRAPIKAPTKLSNAIITKMKLIKHHSLPTGPTSSSTNLFIVYIVFKEKIIFAKYFLINCNYYKIYKNTISNQKRSIFIKYLENHIKIL
jgi:hypothetical protein